VIKKSWQMVTVNESILLMNGAFDEDGTCDY
jgi:hypothetical protein